MKIVIIGATGYTGAPILTEALSRGHEVTAIARDVSKMAPAERLTLRSVDVLDTRALAEVFAGQDAVISAFNPGKDDGDQGTGSIIAAAMASKGTRLLVVGGAGSLENDAGQRLVDLPDFPAEWKVGSLKTAKFLDALRGEPALEWTFLSPAAMLVPGERTGKYRTGGDRLVVDAEGESRISTADLAVAMLDEVEKPQFGRKRFTVAY